VKVNGEMHDIARVVIKGDKLLVYAIHDKAEDNLLSFLDELVTRSSNDKKPVPIQLVQLLTLQFISTETRLPQNTFITIHHSSLYLSALSARPTIIDSPPPRS
jgi:hypothetical protein